MKKYINRNFFWANLFVNQLLKLGVRHVCISPGSRNTPLTLAFAENKSFKKYVHIDERSSGFFALGLAKAKNNPVVILTTSGTAVAELYPAIIEAFIQRIPLIVCTAESAASYLRNTGANQTINQENIFSNHIRKFADFGLPSISYKKLNDYTKKILNGWDDAYNSNPGPVHFNFPFKRPLESNSFTEDIPFNIADFIKTPQIVNHNVINSKLSEIVINNIKTVKRPAILLGWGNFDTDFYKQLSSFSINHNIPVFVDGTSEFRFSKSKNENIVVNQSAFISRLREQPDLIIQFGNAPTSQAMLKFVNDSKVKRYLINKFGDIKDPSKKKGELIKISPLNI